MKAFRQKWIDVSQVDRIDTVVDQLEKEGLDLVSVAAGKITYDIRSRAYDGWLLLFRDRSVDREGRLSAPAYYGEPDADPRAGQ